VSIDTTYLHLDAFVDMVEEPNRANVAAMIADGRDRYRSAWGSSHNHQAWKGGYEDHIVETLNLARVDYQLLNALRPLPFAFSSVVLVLISHDLEKADRYDAHGNAIPALDSKEAKHAYRLQQLHRWDVQLTEQQLNALCFVEGERPGDYSSSGRASNELAAFCHRQDSWSARGWHDKPAAENDSWPGAQRVNSLANVA
jgi:hypothetical protein